MKETLLNYNNNSQNSIIEYAKTFLNKNLIDILDSNSIENIKKEIIKYNGK